jgi:hypothetical protein
MNQIQDQTLEELLADPVIRLVMQSDGFTGAQVRRIAHDARDRLAAPTFEGDSRRPDLHRMPRLRGAGFEADCCC